MQQNAAFNNNCVPPWGAASGTPSICNHVSYFGGFPVQAYDGVRYACLGSDGIMNVCDRNEAIFQNVSLCEGLKYRLTFWYHNLNYEPGTISVGFTNGLTNVSPTDHGIPCFEPEPGSQILPFVTVPSTLEGWHQAVFVFTYSSSINNQLVFWINPSNMAGSLQFDVGIDAVSIICEDSPLEPSFTISGSCPSFNFVGTTNNFPGVGVNNWCWDFGDGSIGSGQQVSHTYTTTGTYMVCLTIADNCGNCTKMICQTIECGTNTSSFTCPCSGPGALNIDAGDAPVDPNQVIAGLSVLSTPLSGGQTNQFLYNNTGKCIAIKGHLMVDNSFDLTIMGGEIRMQPGAKIIVRTESKLTLNSITEGNLTDPTKKGIHGCEKMWRSILVQPGAWLSMAGNIVQDAEIAVDIIGVGINLPSFVANGNDFDRNHIGLQVFQKLFQPFPNSFGGNKFMASSGLLPVFSTGITNWHPLYPYAGLNLLSTVFDVGQTGNASSVNEFTGLRNGILAQKTDLDVYYAEFSSIHGNVNYNQEPIWPISEGFGIVAKGHFLTVHDATFNGVNTNGWRGISSTICNLEAKRNTILNIVSGIFATPGDALTVEISNNTFGTTFAPSTGFGHVGIIVNGNAPNASVTVEGNTIAASGLGPGIWLRNNGMVANPMLRKLLGNTVNDNVNGESAILVENSGRWLIEGNHVNISGILPPLITPPSAGIKLMASDRCILTENDIHLVDGATTTNQTNAIELLSSSNCTLCCNLTEGSLAGNYFSGPCAPLYVRHEQIENHAVGLWCNGVGTTIGDQLWAGNQWLAGYDFLGAWHTGSDPNCSASEFFIEGPQSTNFWPPSRSPNIQDVWFRELEGFSSDCNTSDPSCALTPIPPPEQGRLLTNDEKQIATDTYASSHSYDRITQAEGERELYREMKTNTSLIGQYKPTDLFYAVADDGQLGQLYQVETQSNNLSGWAPAQVARGTEIKHLLDSLKLLMAHIDQQIANALTQTERANFIAQKRNYSALSQTLLVEWIATSDAATIALLDAAGTIQSLSNGIATNSTWQNNRKMVEQIGLMTTDIGNYMATSGQLNELYAIAGQCALEGGDAVLQARALYNSLAYPVVDFDDVLICGLNNDPRCKSPSPRQIQDSLVQLYPNPAQTSFVVLVTGIPLGEPLFLQMFDQSGRLAKIVELGNGSAVIETLAPGMYFSKVYHRQHQLFLGTQKLIVIP